MIDDRHGHLASAQARDRHFRANTAYHEAGHAVAAWSLSQAVRKVTIESSYLTRGRAWAGPIITDAEQIDAKQRALIGTPVLARTRRKLEASVITTLAGPLAEERAAKEGLILKEPPPPSTKYPEGRTAPPHKTKEATIARRHRATTNQTTVGLPVLEKQLRDEWRNQPRRVEVQRAERSSAEDRSQSLVVRQRLG